MPNMILVHNGLKPSNGVITVIGLILPRRPGGSFMASQIIGSVVDKITSSMHVDGHALEFEK